MFVVKKSLSGEKLFSGWIVDLKTNMWTLERNVNSNILYQLNKWFCKKITFCGKNLFVVKNLLSGENLILSQNKCFDNKN